MDNKKKERNCVDKYRNKYKKKRRGFHGYKPEKITITTTQFELVHMQDGEVPILECCGKNRRCRKFKDINKIVPIAVNSNSSQGPSISVVVSRKIKGDSVSKSAMINLQAIYNIIGLNILQIMLNVVGRCISCGELKLQIRENVNKRPGMYEHLVLFCFSCKKDIYSFNTSTQVENVKKKGMMDMNLRSVAAVTSLGGGLASLKKLCMHFDFPRPLAEHSYQSYLKYLEEKLTQKVKKEDCIGHVQKRLGTALRSYKNKQRVQFYLMAKVLAARTFKVVEGY